MLKKSYYCLTLIATLHILQAHGKSIAVFCSANNQIEQNFKETAHELGVYLAKNNFGLITGGGNTGLMKEISDGYCACSGNNRNFFYGVVLHRYLHKEDACHPMIKSENIVVVETLHQRLSYMYKEADMFLVLPGGFGTLHELMDCLMNNKHIALRKPIFLLNIDEYWNNLLNQFVIMRYDKSFESVGLDKLFVIDSLCDLTNSLINC